MLSINGCVVHPKLKQIQNIVQCICKKKKNIISHYNMYNNALTFFLFVK